MPSNTDALHLDAVTLDCHRYLMNCATRQLTGTCAMPPTQVSGVTPAVSGRAKGIGAPGGGAGGFKRLPVPTTNTGQPHRYSSKTQVCVLLRVSCDVLAPYSRPSPCCPNLDRP